MAFRFRAYPTPAQATALVSFQDPQRALWNAANAARIDRYRAAVRICAARSDEALPVLRYQDQNRELTEARAAFDWLRAVPSDYQQALLMFLDRAWTDFMSGLRGMPRFKSKKAARWVPLVSNAASRFRVEADRIRIPRIGWIRFRGHREIQGRPVNVAITRDVDQWFVSITCVVTEPIPVHPHAELSVGLDLGIVSIVTDSNGRKTGNPRAFARHETLLARAQRQLERRKRGSARARRARERVAKIYRRIRRTRNHFLHNISALYTKSHGTVAVEALDVVRMTRRNYNHRAAQKTGLNRSIHDAGWGELIRQIRYKSAREGAVLLEVEPAGTSQICNECSFRDPKNRSSQSAFRCLRCGHTADADSNAARNILRRGLEILSTGEAPVSARRGRQRPKKREADADGSAQQAYA